jgi:putative transposase
MVKKKAREQMNESNQVFDVKKVEEKLKNIKSLSDLTGKNGVIQEMIKQTVERILKAEQEAHLGYEPYKKASNSTKNSRNGYSVKTLRTPSVEVDIEIPRDREGSFEPEFIKKHQSFDPDLENRVISMYARGMSTRDIGQQLEEFYGTEVSPALISKITDKVLEGVHDWQKQPLNDVYAVVFMDAIHYKIRQDSKVISKAAYTCMGINLEGNVSVLGNWLSENEGAHFWQGVLADLKTRGVKDILIACVDGLKGFPDAIEAIFPRTQTQLCIVHQIRNSLRYLGSKYHKEFMKDLKEVYRASTYEIAETNLQKLENKWGEKCPAAVQSWRTNWGNLSTYFQFPDEIRKIIYTTNAVEALHRQFRKVTKTRGAFPTDDSLRKLLYLATLDLKGALRQKNNWAVMLGQLKNVFGDRIK